MPLVNLLAVAALLGVTPASAQLVVNDPAQTAVSQLQLHVQQLHTAFMKLQLVQDAEMLKNNYLQSKEYYDTIYAHSQHRGGLMGYYKDYFQEQLDNIAADQWRQVTIDGTSITGDTEVGKLVAQGATAVGAGTGSAIGSAAGVVGSGMDSVDCKYLSARGIDNPKCDRQLLYGQKARQVAAADQVIANSEARADATSKMIADLVRRGSGDMTDHERESVDTSARLLELQLLSEIRQEINLNAQIANAQMKQTLAESAAAAKMSSALSAFGLGAAARKGASDSQDTLVHELQRRPGER